MSCTDCRRSYHLGGCSGIADKTFTTMGPVKREKWRCRACRSGNPTSGVDIVEDAASGDRSELQAQIVVIGQKLDLLLSLKGSVDKLSMLPMKVDDLMSLRPAVESMRETVNSMQTSVQFFSDQYDSLMALVASNEKEIKSLRAEVGVLKETVSAQALSLQGLQSDLNDLEQYGRRQNMEIHGLPYSPTENLEVALQDMAVKLGIDSFQAVDVVAVHRLPAKRDSAPPVLVRFVSVRAKEPWMAARGRLNSLPGLPSQCRLFFNENLTRANKELFWQARSRGRERGFRFVWVKHGKVFARKGEGSRIIKINYVNDLENIL